LLRHSLRKAIDHLFDAWVEGIDIERHIRLRKGFQPSAVGDRDRTPEAMDDGRPLMIKRYLA
jgi:hypothetical protein